MTHNAEITNTGMLQLVAEKLGPVKDKVVFLGGAVMPFLITDPNMPMTRAAKDVDIIFEPETQKELYEFEDELRDLGFKKTHNGLICQWMINNVYIEVFPTDPDVITSFVDNRWWIEAEQSAIKANIGNGLSINMVPGHCSLGLKLCAFMRRGKGNYLKSYDIDDLLLIIGGRAEIEHEVTVQASPALKKFIIEELKNIYKTVNEVPGQVRAETLSRVQRMIASW